MAGEVIRVMSYNIQGHAALKRRRYLSDVAQVIRQLRPDLVGLQEVHKNTHGLRSGDQLADLAASTGMELFFGRSMARLGGEYGNAILTTGAVLEARVHELPGHGEPRTALEARIDLRNLRFTAIVTHLAAWFRFTRRTRAAQLEKLAEIIGNSKPPYLIMGDFNSSPRSPEMAAMLRSENLRLCGEHTEISHRFSRQRLDYIFADPSWQKRDAWVVRLGPSDHWPLLADLAGEVSSELRVDSAT
jgi:endonuclease/exonuclease/phosphatase family metal-dependent hydrolase